MGSANSIAVIRPSKQFKTPVSPKDKATNLQMVRLAFGTLGRIFPKWSAKVALRLFSTPQKRARHQISDTVLETARITDLLYGRTMLKVYEWGSGDRTVILVHGWESRGTALRKFVPQLLEQGFKVVTFDAPAHGNSTGKQTDLSQFAGAVKAVINRQENVEAVVTHSFGGAATLFAMTDIDSSIHLPKLVLVAMPASMDQMVFKVLRMLNVSQKAKTHFVNLLGQKVGVPLKDVHVEHLKNNLNADKVLVVHDRQDEVVPFSNAQRIVESWDNSELMETDGFGHFHLVKSPLVVKSVVAFITDKVY